MQPKQQTTVKMLTFLTSLLLNSMLTVHGMEISTNKNSLKQQKWLKLKWKLSMMSQTYNHLVMLLLRSTKLKFRISTVLMVTSRLPTALLRISPCSSGELAASLSTLRSLTSITPHLRSLWPNGVSISSPHFLKHQNTPTTLTRQGQRTVPYLLPLTSIKLHLFLSMAILGMDWTTPITPKCLLKLLMVILQHGPQIKLRSSQKWLPNMALTAPQKQS